MATRFKSLEICIQILYAHFCLFVWYGLIAMDTCRVNGKLISATSDTKDSYLEVLRSHALEFKYTTFTNTWAHHSGYSSLYNVWFSVIHSWASESTKKNIIFHKFGFEFSKQRDSLNSNVKWCEALLSWLSSIVIPSLEKNTKNCNQLFFLHSFIHSSQWVLRTQIKTKECSFKWKTKSSFSLFKQ